MHISCVLRIVYHDLCSDKERKEFNNECMEFIKALREEDDIQSRIQTISVLSVLLQGPFDTGNTILGSQNLFDLMLQMANSNDPIQERIAVEAIVLSASKKYKAIDVIQQGANILKNLYKSMNEEDIKRLSKLASSKGTDASTNLVAEGSCQTLSRACCKFLTTSQSFNIRRWSADSLAYLSLDADVKEELVDNLLALKALFSLCQCQDAHILYLITTIFVNLTNTYDIIKEVKEIIELATYTKQHIPNEHPKDDKTFFDQRRKKLIEAGIIPILVQLCKHKSENCREQIVRIFLGLCENEKYRGSIVAAGGAKALLPLALEGTSIGMTKATQALAKIAITTNPEIAFPGQRMLELVRPIIKILKIEHTALENFEALMALTNLASISENVRKRILKEDGFSSIEQYMFEEHPLLRRAAVESVLLSLSLDLEFIKDLNLENEERQHLNNLIQNNQIIYLQYRTLYIIRNIVKANKQLAIRIVETELMDILFALKEIKDDHLINENNRKIASDIIEICLKYGIIQQNKDHTIKQENETTATN
ncbi:unnamed protein product [Rotaria sp. Silwood1]|nr:unnamed protein product [Rotaria sp. Silwood1]CAF1613122.1 unnamed protein product [Rotaria sp. Silwood1]